MCPLKCQVPHIFLVFPLINNLVTKQTNTQNLPRQEKTSLFLHQLVQTWFNKFYSCLNLSKHENIKMILVVPR